MRRYKAKLGENREPDRVLKGTRLVEELMANEIFTLARIAASSFTTFFFR